MSTNNMQYEFVSPWVAVGKFNNNLTTELHREVTEHHVLWRKQVRPLAQRVDCDDVLFEIEGPVNTYAVVHLTWSGKSESEPQCPDSKTYATFVDWVRDGMMPDHQEYVGSDKE